MPDDPATSENPFASPQNECALTLNEVVGRGPKITIADILFCTFAVSLSLMTQIQPWGGFEEITSTYVVSNLITALGASVFFVANRRRRFLKSPFFSMAPGHFVALGSAGQLASQVFQFFVSFLDARHVGAPIHILAELSPAIWCVVISAMLFYRVSLSPRWQAYFIAAVGFGLFYGLSIAAARNASRSDMTDPMNVASYYLWRVSFGGWSLAVVFLVVAYFTDIIMKEKRDWLHHAGVLLCLASNVAGIIEDSTLRQTVRMIYYQLTSI